MAVPANVIKLVDRFHNDLDYREVIVELVMDHEQRHHLTSLRQIHLRRLHELEYKAATFGLNTPSELIIEIQDIRRAIIHLDKQLSPAAPRMLREPVPDFAGRQDESDRLVQHLSQAHPDGLGLICCIRGLGGIGKTELAYVVAHRLAPLFPDSQTLVALGGMSDNALTPEQVLQTIIHAFERGMTLSDDLSELQTIYRTVLVGKRVLILADDAKDAMQVRSLIPPQGSALIITSRARFTLPGMATLDLEVLPALTAEHILQTICPRLGSYATKLAQHCGFLPLALRVSASLLATNDMRNIARYLTQLEMARIAHLRDPDNPDDPQASVEASLHLSYRALKPIARSILCQLSVFPDSFDLAAAEAVVEDTVDVESALDLLRRHSLIEWDSALERYSLHDLVRAFALPLLQNADAVQMRHARHYAQVVLQASRLYWQGGTAFLSGLELADRERVHIDTGWAWALSHAGDSNADTLLLEYPNAMVYIGLRSIEIARERVPHLEAAVAVARQREQPTRLIWHLTNLGTIYNTTGSMRQAIECYEQVLEIARKTNNRRAEGNVLGHLGQAYKQLGDLHRAIDYLKQGLAIAQEYGQRQKEGRTLHRLGRVYADLEEVNQAINCFEQSLIIWQEIENHPGVAGTSWDLGLLLAKQGDLARAAELMQIYVDYQRTIGHPDLDRDIARLEQVRQQLGRGESEY